MYFQTDGSERMRITSGGNVGIGTTSPQTQLDIANGLMFGTIDAFPSATYDAAAVIAKTGSLGSAPFNNAGSIVYRARVTSTAGRSSHIFYTGSPSTERMRLDESGNLGLGVTPSAWGATWRALELEYSSAGTAIASLYPAIMANTYNTGGGFFYKVTGQASYYQQITGQHRWFNAPSGTAGNAITFTQAMTLFSTGNLAVGGTTDNGYKLNITGDVNVGSSNGYYFGGSSTAVYRSTNDLRFYVNSGDRMAITSTGNVGIGLTNPAQRFVVRGQNGNSALEFDNKASNTEIVSYDRVASAYRDLYLHTSSASPTMVLNTSGNVGIGTTSPTEKLDVVGRVKASIDFASNNGTVETRLSWSSTPAGVVGTISNHPLEFYTNATAKMRLDASGNLLVATTSPSYNASGRGNITIGGSSSSILGLQVGGVAKGYVYHDNVNYGLWNTANGYMGFGTNDTERMRITSGGNVGIGTTSLFAKLQINASGAGIVDNTILENTNAAAANLGSALTFAGVGTVAQTVIRGAWDGSATTDAYMSFLTRGSNSVQERMRITSGGELLINTTTDAGDFKLQVSGNAYVSGSVGIGSTSTSNGLLTIAGTAPRAINMAATFTGGTSRFGILQNNTVNSDVTSSAVNNYSQFATQAAAFTLTTASHYTIAGITIGAGSSVTNQIGYRATNITEATNNYGFYGEIASGTGRWNLYMAGTANNYMNGNLGIGVTTPTEKLEVNGAIKTAAPSGGTAKPWKLGGVQSTTIVLDDGAYVDVEIDGVAYKLALAVIP